VLVDRASSRQPFSVTVRMDPAVKKAIAAIPEQSWTTIKYPRAVWDEKEQRWISEAQVAETTFTAFTSHPKKRQVDCRLVVRRVARLNPASAVGQGELFTTWRHHGFITNSTLTTTTADETHRDHAIIEQVIAELKDGPLAHAPSGRFQANAAWLALACVAFNLLRAAGAAASTRHAKARWATPRTHLIAVPARVATSARRLVLHLPTDWPWAPMARPLDHRHDLTAPARTAPEEQPQLEEPDRPADLPRPPAGEIQIIRRDRHQQSRNHHRWIRAELVPRAAVSGPSAACQLEMRASMPSSRKSRPVRKVWLASRWAPSRTTVARAGNRPVAKVRSR